MSADRLRAMVEAATPGPWCAYPHVRHEEGHVVSEGDPHKPTVALTDGRRWLNYQADARLIALAPELARWAADAAAALERARDTAQIVAAGCDTGHLDFTMDDADALLVRLAGIVGEPE